MANNHDSLLEQIRAAVDCEYLSDLRQPSYSAAVSDAVSRWSTSDFPPREWSAAASYILNLPADLEPDTARSLLLAGRPK